MTGVDLSKLDSTNQVLQADPKAATSVKRAHQAAVDVLHAMNPPVPPPATAMRLAYDTRQGTGWAEAQALGFNTLFAGYDLALLNQVKASGGKVVVNLSGEIAAGTGGFMPAARACAATGAVAAFAIWDEPDPSMFATLKAATTAVHSDPATKGIPTYITYYDAASIGQTVGCADLYGLDIYPSKFGWQYSLITELAAAADKAGLHYIVVLGAFTAPGYPLPTAAQYVAMTVRAMATKQVGQGTYTLPVDSSLLAAVKAGNQ